MLDRELFCSIVPHIPCALLAWLCAQDNKTCTRTADVRADQGSDMLGIPGETSALAEFELNAISLYSTMRGSPVLLCRHHNGRWAKLSVKEVVVDEGYDYRKARVRASCVAFHALCAGCPPGVPWFIHARAAR